METIVREILGYTFEEDRQAGQESRAYYVKAGSPENARDVFRQFADDLLLADGTTIETIDLDEEKNVNGLYFGTISFRTERTKRKISDDIYEIFGEKYTQGRKDGSHERTFRVRADNVQTACMMIEVFIRSTAPTSGRLHIDTFTADEGQDFNGWFTVSVSYSNPSHKGTFDNSTGIVPAYGDRATESTEEASSEFVFTLKGYSSAEAARNALKDYVGQGFDEITAEEDSSGAANLYTGRVRFKAAATDGSGSGDGDDENDDEQTDTRSNFSFEVSNSQEKFLHSIKTVKSYLAQGRTSPAMMAPDHNGLINVTADGVEGVTLPVGVSTFTETHVFRTSFVTQKYRAHLCRSVGKVNSSSFRGFKEGEVQFLGATGSCKSGDKIAELTFRFATSETRSEDIKGIGNVEKKGFEYVWVQYEDGIDADTKVKKPVAAYVEQVFRSVDFSTLGT